MPGPKATSQRRASSTCAACTDHSTATSVNHARAGAQRYWPLIHEPRGRPLTIRPSAASRASTLVETYWRASHLLPLPATISVRSAGRSSASSPAVASPRDTSASSVACSSSLSQRPTSGATAESERCCSSLRRSLAAIARVHAACTTGASSVGTTNMVRRMPSIRTSVRSS